jgi:hypothetical protein
MEDLYLAMVFGEWAAAEQSINEAVDDDDETNRRCHAAGDLARRVAAIPAAGLTGFVLKSVVLLLYDPVLPSDVDDTTTATIARALLADAVRLVPDLQHCPVAARAVRRAAG